MYYNGSKILNTLDIDKQKPEIYMVTGNRSSGKTTFFNKKMVDTFLEEGKQFALLYRFSYELQNCANAFFDDIRGLFYPNMEMVSVSKCRGLYKELILNGDTCGYALCLNCADTIKRNSHVFTNVQHILMDEFQSETNKYCEDEVTKFISIHKSIARGAGKQSRFVPVYMVSNCVSILNPYFDAMGVTDRLKQNTKILRGRGWVLEQNFNKEAANALANSRFMQAFEGNKSIPYITENVYLNDNNTFVEKKPNHTKYVCGLKHNDTMFNIAFDLETDTYYTSPGYDKSFPLVLAANIESHTDMTTYSPNSLLVKQLRLAFHSGNFRFKNLKSKNATLAYLHY